MAPSSQRSEDATGATSSAPNGHFDTPAGSAATTTTGSTALAPAVTDIPGSSCRVTTSFVIPNLHCSSCTTTIRLLLEPLSPPPHYISTNILTHEVTVVHSAELTSNEILKVLLEAEFDIDSVSVNRSGSVTSPSSLQESSTGGANDIEYVNTTHERFFLEDWGELMKAAFESGKRRKKHVEVCDLCKSKEVGRVYPSPSLMGPGAESSQWSIDDEKATMLQMDRSSGKRTGSLELIDGAADQMTIIPYKNPSYSASAVRSDDSISQTSPSILRSTSEITPGITLRTGPHSVMASSETLAVHPNEMGMPNKESGGQGDAIVVEIAPAATIFEATFSIEGMTCSACTGKVNDTIGHLPGVKNVSVALMTNSATVQFEGVKEDAIKIVDEIEDIGYGCVLDSIKEYRTDDEQVKVMERTVQIRIDGMFCESCPTRVLEALQILGESVQITKEPTFSNPIVEIFYLPAPPTLTIRQIISTVNAINPVFSASIYHPPTIEERSRHIQARELHRLILRAILCVIVAIPTFLLGIVWMSLVPKDNKIREYFEQPMWAGQASRLEWALFFLATPVQFFIADVFHVRAYKEIKALWRPGNQIPILRRFYRFGSMNLLISLGVSIAYFASVGLLAVSASRKNKTQGHHTTYFDSTVFLTMFLLIGRCLEAYSKIKTSDAVSMLGKLRPAEALLLHSVGAHTSSNFNGSTSDVTKQEIGESTPMIKKVPVDMLEVGDTILVQHGGSPPADGKISLGETKFDESSLTGESRPVQKKEGDVVFAGTINKGKAVRVLVDAVSGESMLDQIVKVVREGQTRRAPIERIADMITGYFVPLICLIAISTWVIWLALGQSGVLPDYWLDVDEGSWPVWSLGFAIAVLVVACPCGIGLAAPTALFVGSGLAAKYGILAKGGGEAFQEASWLDVVVFDKTGTLTEGGEPRVTDEEIFVTANDEKSENDIEEQTEIMKLVYAIATGLEEMSSHPLARAVVCHCEGKDRAKINGSEVEEIPGRGLRGVFTVVNNNQSYEAIIGNEAFMSENGVAELGDVTSSLLHSWKSKAKSVVLLALKPQSDNSLASFPSNTYTLAAAFAASDPLRPEAAYVVKQLQSAGISVWMISGDNPVTATAVASIVGIPRDNVIAGVLPTQKAEKVEWLQKNATLRPRRTWNPFSKSKKVNKRAIVAMVGDGINDAPALAVSDVGVAIGSGSDVAIGSAKFILVGSSLHSLLTLTELARVVFRRVKFNFFWACVYNLIALPVAAGVLYPVGMRNWTPSPGHEGMEKMAGMAHVGMENGGGPQRIRLEPVWASLAMALSSVSVVGSSLLLRTRLWGLGFRPSYNGGMDLRRERVEERERDAGEVV